MDVLTHVGSAGTAPPYSPEMIPTSSTPGRPVVVTAAHRSWVYPDTAAFPERLQDPAIEERLPAPDIYDEVQQSFAELARAAATSRGPIARCSSASAG